MVLIGAFIAAPADRTHCHKIVRLGRTRARRNRPPLQAHDLAAILLAIDVTNSNGAGESMAHRPATGGVAQRRTLHPAETAAMAISMSADRAAISRPATNVKLLL
jgi:hypothetical protein